MEKFKAYRIRETDKKAVGGFEEMALDDLDRGELVVRVAYSRPAPERSSGASPASAESTFRGP